MADFFTSLLRRDQGAALGLSTRRDPFLGGASTPPPDDGWGESIVDAATTGDTAAPPGPEIVSQQADRKKKSVVASKAPPPPRVSLAHGETQPLLSERRRQEAPPSLPGKHPAGPPAEAAGPQWKAAVPDRPGEAPLNQAPRVRLPMAEEAAPPVAGPLQPAHEWAHEGAATSLEPEEVPDAPVMAVDKGAPNASARGEVGFVNQVVRDSSAVVLRPAEAPASTPPAAASPDEAAPTALFPKPSFAPSPPTVDRTPLTAPDLADGPSPQGGQASWGEARGALIPLNAPALEPSAVPTLSPEVKEPAEAGPTVIKVSIGRVHIHAPKGARKRAAQPAPARGRSKPAISLNHYLDQRNRGRR